MERTTFDGCLGIAGGTITCVETRDEALPADSNHRCVGTGGDVRRRQSVASTIRPQYLRSIERRDWGSKLP